jgi:Ribulose-phosphate 3 epimerase family
MSYFNAKWWTLLFFRSLTAYFLYTTPTDNHYVPNLTIGPMVCKALRDHGVTADIDVHLMVQPVDQMIQVSSNGELFTSNLRFSLYS